MLSSLSAARLEKFVLAAGCCSDSTAAPRCQQNTGWVRLSPARALAAQPAKAIDQKRIVRRRLTDELIETATSKLRPSGATDLGADRLFTSIGQSSLTRTVKIFTPAASLVCGFQSMCGRAIAARPHHPHSLLLRPACRAFARRMRQAAAALVGNPARPLCASKPTHEGCCARFPRRPSNRWHCALMYHQANRIALLRRSR